MSLGPFKIIVSAPLADALAGYVKEADLGDLATKDEVEFTDLDQSTRDLITEASDISEQTAAELSASIRQHGGEAGALEPVQQWTTGLGFIVRELYSELEHSRPITDARFRRINPLGFVTFEEALDGSSSLAAKEEDQAGALPIATDGQSLTLWRAQLATAMAGGDAVARVMLTGDSWTEKRPIPQALADMLRADYGNAGGGWIACDSYLTASDQDLGPLDGATWGVSGWTLFDITASTVLPAFGCSHDGQALYTATSTATATATFEGTEVSIFRPKTAGSLRYRVDGGAWTTLTGDGSNDLDVTTVSGLSAGAHTLEIDTTPNTGGETVALFGIRYATTNGAGVELLKCGNSSMDGTQLAVFVNDFVAEPVAELDPHLCVIIMATNDYRRSGRTPAALVAALSAYVEQVRSVAPDCGFVFVLPADSDATAIVPLTDYRDAIAAFASAGGHEVYNMHDDWSDWPTEDARGQWLDSLHVSAAGAFRLAARLKRLILDL